MESIDDASMVIRYFPCVVLPGPLQSGRQPALCPDLRNWGPNGVGNVGGRSKGGGKNILSVTVGHGLFRRLPSSP
jgi:hypothetical protein